MEVLTEALKGFEAAVKYLQKTIGQDAELSSHVASFNIVVNTFLLVKCLVLLDILVWHDRVFRKG